MSTRVKVTRKSHSRREGGRLKTYHVGDEFDATDREVSQLADRIEVVKDKPKRGRPAGNQTTGASSGQAGDGQA